MSSITILARSTVSGTSKRIQLLNPSKMTLKQLADQIATAFNCADSDNLSICKQPAKEFISLKSTGKTIETLGLRHGDMILVQLPGDQKTSTISVLDQKLFYKDASIKRPYDPKRCSHLEGGRCKHCTYLDPWDEQFIKQQGIKHLSFHVYLRKLRENTDLSLILEQPNYEIKRSCPNHAPYPAGICTKCQPSAITLTSQSFRMVDHVELADPNIIEDFIGKWRSTGVQQFAYLYGHYEEYEEVPLGIRAVVEVVYRPPQEGSIDGFRLIDDPNKDTCNFLANQYGLVLVGMIYTDLLDAGDGKVFSKRKAETFFVSSAECLWMGQHQLSNPFHLKSTSSLFRDSTFSSRFVTCIVTGDQEGNIGLDCYQVSVDCEALVHADLIEPSTDPRLMLVKENHSPAGKYIPDLFYTQVNEYGRMVKIAAHPTFPVDYLLVSLTHGFPKNPNPKFPLFFPSPHEQTVIQVILHQYKDDLIKLVNSFGFVLYLLSESLLPSEDLHFFVEFLNTKNSESTTTLKSWLRIQNTLNTNIETTLQSLEETGLWPCRHCTFLNKSTKDSCEMCALPRDT